MKFNMDMDTDTVQISGMLRSIETRVRMIKERRDKCKYTELRFHKILEMLAESDGFTAEEVELLKATNKISGSMAHGNYHEAMDKMDKYILPKYFPNTNLIRLSPVRKKIPEGANTEELLKALVDDIGEDVISTKESDIFESYMVAKYSGYVEAILMLTNAVDKLVNSKFEIQHTQ